LRAVARTFKTRTEARLAVFTWIEGRYNPRRRHSALGRIGGAQRQHRSSPELEQAIRQYLQSRNAHPKPFVWPQPADEILASIERFGLRTSGSRP